MLKDSLRRFYDYLDATRWGAMWTFLLKQAWAALFGGLLLIAIAVTTWIPLPWLHRYDWLFLIAVGIQVFMIATKLEHPHEVLTITAFHLVGLAMELFKTHPSVGSWTYPEAAVIQLGTVPLFSGFMYAAVGSYIARAWRVLELSFTHYPKVWPTILVSVAIYLNFFTHHFVYDIRYILFACLVLIYWRTVIHYRLNRRHRKMPLLIGLGLVSGVIWLAENAATFFNVWLYPDQIDGWQPVHISKYGAWFLLIVISFVMVERLQAYYRRRDFNGRDAITRRPAN